MNKVAPLPGWATRRYVEPRIIDLREAAARRNAAARGSRRGSLPTDGTRDRSADDDRGDSGGGGKAGERRGDRWRRALVIAGVLLGTAGIIGSWMWAATADQRALRALPAPQRAQLLHSALQNLNNVCDPFPPRSIRTFCRDQAELAISFDECDSACLSIARRYLTQPTR
jgi:hypothetical protein